MTLCKHLIFLAWMVAACHGTPSWGQALRFRTPELPPAMLGEAYRAPVEVLSNGRCTVADVFLTLVDGTLPPGLELDLTGIRGTPHRTGTFPIVIQAENACSAAVQPFTLVVAHRPMLSVNPTELHFKVKAGEAAAAPQTLLVSSDWYGFPYQLSSGSSSWLRVGQRGGVTPREGLALQGDPVVITVERGDRKPGVYQELIRVTGWQSANSPTVRVTLTVEDTVSPPSP